MLYQFNDLTRPFQFRNADPVLDAVKLALRGWRIRRWPGMPNVRPAARIVRTLQGWGISSDKHPIMDPCPDMGDTVCDILAELGRQYLADLDGVLFMHCAAFRICSGVVIVPNTFRAGKSVLTSHMAMRGHRVWCDDIVPVDPTSRTAIAAGYLPRLRFPLPENSGREFRKFVDDTLVLKGERYGYIDPGASNVARFGERLPIVGAALLDRSETPVTPKIEPITKGLTMRYAINRNFSYQLQGEDMLRAFIDVLGAAPCYRVTYDAAEDATDMIIDRFSR